MAHPNLSTVLSKLEAFRSAAAGNCNLGDDSRPMAFDHRSFFIFYADAIDVANIDEIGPLRRWLSGYGADRLPTVDDFLAQLRTMCEPERQV